MVRGRSEGDSKLGVWTLESTADEKAGLDEQLECLFVAVRGCASGLAQLLARGLVVETFVGVLDVNAGSEVVAGSSRLSELALLVVDLRLDLYPKPDGGITRGSERASSA